MSSSVRTVIQLSWSQEDEAFLREKWLLGWTDPQIGQALTPQRSDAAIQSKRKSIGLVAQNHPDRPNFRSKEKSFTYGEKENILKRSNAGETAEALAKDYDVDVDFMKTKIRQFLTSKPLPQKNTPTKRSCLRCGTSFLSGLPKSTNRICRNCEEALPSLSSSFG